MCTDSTIALAWIKTEPHKLKTFVSNRVVEIQALSKDYHWKHVSSKDNPTDLISRSCNVDELLKNEMWFSCPDLQTDKYEDNQLFPDPSYRDELKCAVTLSMTECSSNFYDKLFNVTNNFIKLIRIFSFIFRFINNIKAKESCNKEKYLTADEIKRSTEFLAKIAQLSEFKAEIDALKKVKVFQKQQRNKWQFEKNNVAVGCLVLLKENDLPPCKWAMARILEVIYGTDGKIFKLLSDQCEYGGDRSRCTENPPATEHQTIRVSSLRLTPVDLPYVPILLNETFITALWDTGAEKSFISEEVYRKYFSYRPLQKTKDRVVTVQGAPVLPLRSGRITDSDPRIPENLRISHS
ncbi:DUF5641 domain-containing protein [Trichonephila clavipes]|nr:DUF5641 domain-containing protein [Trichonephila clavipes]